MWNVISCAVRGRSHVKEDAPCQDKTYFAHDNDVHVIALADGAGSAKFSHFGAEVVTKFVCDRLAEKFDVYFASDDGVAIKQELLRDILNALKEKAVEQEYELKELASTLLCVAVKNECFIIIHIGDGVIGYLKNGELKVASHPENGEFANTTVFTTSKDAIATMKLFKGSLDDIEGFVLMSDGTEASLYDKKEKRLADILKKIMQMATVIDINVLREQLKHSFEKVIRNATTDDCSIVLMASRNANFSGYTHLNSFDKYRLLKISTKTSKRILRRYDAILEYLLEKQSIVSLAKKIHLKANYTKKYIDKLLKLNFIESVDDYYHTILIMEK